MLVGPELMPPPNDPVQIGEWLADPRDDSITRGGERVKLEPRTMRLLMRLVQSPGAVVSLDDLLGSVWSGVVVGSASVYQSMSQLRRLLGDTDDPPRYIETVARKGYRLIATVSGPPPAGVPVTSEPRAEAQPVPAVPAWRAPRRRWVALATAVVVGLAWGTWQFWTSNIAMAQNPTVAVLPFSDDTEGKTEQAFCDGLAEETSNWLAQIPRLRVVARTSAFKYRDRQTDVRDIGRELNTTHVVEGSLQRSGNRLRIQVHFVDTRTGIRLWSQSFDVEGGDVLAMQEDIARKVADNFEIRISADVESRFAGRGSRNEDAQRLYWQAKGNAQNIDRDSNEKAISQFRAALKADPDFTLAKIWLARAIMARRYLNSQPIEALAPEVEPLLADAARTANDLVDLYVVRGYFHTEMRHREAAMRDLEHAVKLNTNSVGAASSLGFFYLTAGEPREALTYFSMASGLDPLSYYPQGSRCVALVDLGQIEAAVPFCARARELEPKSSWVYNISAALEEARGDLEAAFRWSDMAMQHGRENAAVQGDRAGWLVTLGLVEDARAVFERAFTESPDDTRHNTALMYAGTLAAVNAAGAQGLRDFIRGNGLENIDDPAQMFQLANAALVARDSALANQYVSRALASPSLSPEDIASTWQASGGHSDLVVIAVALRARGDNAGADARLGELAALLERMVDAGVQTKGLYYVRAQLECLRGQGDKAMADLQHAVKLGWRDAWIAERQPALESLRERKDFRELIGAVNARNASTAAKLRPRLLG